jgi:hypothetical protein
MSSALIVILVLAGMGALAFVALFVVGAVVGFREAARSKVASAAASSAPFSASYTTTNGLLTAHYPDDFAAKKLDAATLVVSRNLSSGGDEALTLAALAQPITDDPHELARVLWTSHDKSVAGQGGTSAKVGEREADCAGRYRGVEVEGTFTLSGGNPYASKGCFFIHAGRGYELRYDVSSSRLAEEAPLLTRIIDATDFAP